MQLKQTQLLFFFFFNAIFTTIYSDIRLVKGNFLSYLEEDINVDKQVNC